MKPSSPPFDLLVGLDRADAKAGLCLLDPRSGATSPLTLATDPATLDAWLARFRADHPVAGSPRVATHAQRAAGDPWIVFAKGFAVGPDSVRQYLGRYTHRVALSNGCLLRLDDRTVTFRYKDYRHGDVLREMTLDEREFVRRFACISSHPTSPRYDTTESWETTAGRRTSLSPPVAAEGTRR